MTTEEQLQQLFRAALAEATRGGTDTEQHAVANSWLTSFKESFQTEWGYDPDAVWDHQNEAGFSLAAVRESIQRTTLREAVTELQFSALTRYGIIKQIIGGYNLAQVAYKDIALIVNSNSSEEDYAPLYGSDIPDEVEDGEEAGESRLSGFQVRIRNARFAKILAISKTLFDDDQTGQLKMESAQFGKRMTHAEEKVAMNNFFNNAIAANAKMPVTNIAGTAVGQGNVTTTAGQLSQARLEDGWTAASYVVDPLGNLIVPDFNVLLIAKVDELLAMKLMESMYSPSVPGSTGAVGYFMTKNVLDGKFSIKATPFINIATGTRAGIASGAPWALLEKNSKAMVFQNRTALKVEQEASNAGRSFDRNEVRLLSQRRFGSMPVDFHSSFIGN